MRYAYPCNLEPEEEEGFEGAFTVSFPDIPGALTCGYDRGEALENAEEVLELVLGHYIETNEELPTPGPLTGGQELVTVRPPFAAKLALYAAMRRQNITLDDLADRLGLSAADVEEMLDPCIHSSISRITGALQAAGCRLVVEDLTADGGEHICYPALTRGNLRMSYREFIRRVRRYALVNDLEWRIEDTAFDEETISDEEGCCLLRVGNHAITLPEQDELGPDILESALKDLGINLRQF